MFEVCFKVCVCFLGLLEQSTTHWVAKTKERYSLSALENRSLNSGLSEGLSSRCGSGQGPSLLLSDVWWLLGILGAPELTAGSPSLCHGLHMGSSCHISVFVSWSPLLIRKMVMLDWGPPYASLTSSHLLWPCSQIRSSLEVSEVRTPLCLFLGVRSQPLTVFHQV